MDSSGNLYAADAFNNKIRKITPAGYVSTFAGSGTRGRVDGPGPTASFYLPASVAVDLSGNVFVSDLGNNRIRKITSAGTVTNVAGSGGWGDVDGPGPAASFNAPGGVAVDPSGTVYVADTGNNKIRKVTPDGYVSTFAGSGAAGSVDGPGPTASFDQPWHVAVDSSGVVFVADSGNNKIRKVSPAGEVSTFAGSGAAGSVDGPGPTASFGCPAGVAVDSSGVAYVADTCNNKIRKITPAGDVSTFAGSGASGHQGGFGANAAFSEPSDVAVDATGDVYVSDSGNAVVRKITVTRGGTCVQDASTVCLIGRRYRVTSHWQNQYAGGQAGTLSATALTDATATFWYFDANTFEYLIRVNTATDNGHAWISISTFTDVEFWIEVTDMASGQHAEYHSPAGNRTMLYDYWTFIFP
ncbi:MAG TPA: NHL repeat-containing protein [Thermoanaerobaculia bacterium]|nr:NHL repeat-containing protein [Thermoanaerobaculia bacterium]